ncbi:NGG1p interacting factor 3 [Calocera viscosa TUFC12733]|uniref:NGG1p interacting factor 3 n=1 Tax=Calocera viscosa (strain TUFC12733) TaxID=1330018 RepID=A0A167JYE6_CALVF|nr:NGG1p interacting factor 3 [Calocera viscosa TUFC12733]
MSVIQQVARAMERIAPLSLAESWDNVGILLEAVKPLTSQRVLLTIDLTPPVLASALSHPNPPSTIISYHPPIFAPLKSLTHRTPLQHTLLSLAREGISVYTPHTALDNTDQGVNWWLAQAFQPFRGRWEKWERGGGVVHLPRPVGMREVVQEVKRHLGVQTVNVGTSNPEGTVQVQRIALCAGSGGTSLAEQGGEADCWLTGEMGHHELLAALASGKTVILCGHTNTERGYLPLLREKLLGELGQGWEVDVSEVDGHPLTVQ